MGRGCALCRDALSPVRQLDEINRVIAQDDFKREQGQNGHQRRQIQRACIGQELPDLGIDRVQQLRDPVPNLAHQRLVQVQHSKIDQPAHDDMGDHDKLGDTDHQKQDLEDGNHDGPFRETDLIWATGMVQGQK